jgi:hypothetical protein
MANISANSSTSALRLIEPSARQRVQLKSSISRIAMKVGSSIAMVPAPTHSAAFVSAALARSVDTSSVALGLRYRHEVSCCPCDRFLSAAVPSHS